MKITWRHYYIFPRARNQPAITTLLTAGAWDQVRTAEPNDPFHMPADRGDWIRLCEKSTAARACAVAVAGLLDRTNINTVLSVGVGRACAEFHLKAIRPQTRLICGEFSPHVVERLRAVFHECDEVREFNMLQDSWPPLGPNGLVLLNRVDTELNDEQWKRVFDRLSANGVDDVLLIATGFLDPKTVALEIWRRVLGLIRSHALTHAGYSRTKGRMKELWSPGYSIAEEASYGDLTGFWLRRVAISPKIADTD